MGITQFTFILADGKKTIETLQSTKNQTKTARLLRLSFEQVHGVMLRAVERGLEKRDKNCIYKHVCMDEKSIRRGHEYVSMLYDGETGQVIEVESGRKSESVDNLCTRALTEEQRNAVETVCTDMWEAFINGALKYFPNARHCHDLYHCVTYLNNAVDKVRKREVKEFKELRHTKYIWLKDMSRYTPNDRMRFDKLENAEYQVSQAWKVKELFRDLLRLYYHGDMEAYGMLGDWMAGALRYNIGEINDVVFMFKRHLKGIISAMVTGANNGKAERTNGSIQEIKTIGRGYGTAERYRIAILFFYGGLDMSIVNLH
ncbi:ISL3 family transposase [Bacteroides thetaiotaomicron]|nr:ISL3 family transposase [Bacteroides thetaiotaomicron]